MSFSDLKSHYQILKGHRDELYGIRELYEEKLKECEYLKKDIKKGGFSAKYKELELVEAMQNVEYIRIAFDKKHREFDPLRKSMDPTKILDTRYREIKQKEFELSEKYDKTDKILQECEAKEIQLENACKDYEEIKTEILVLNNRSTKYDYGNNLFKRSKDCLNQLNGIEKDLIIHRQLYELSKIEDTKKKEEVNKEMGEFFSICECLEEDVVLEEGILI